MRFLYRSGIYRDNYRLLTDFNSIIQNIAIMAIPVVLAITFHEAAHGWVANKLGDPTAKHAGRLTLNPIAHIDPFGTILLPIITYIFAGFIIGAAKPVPVNFANLRNPKRDMIWVAAAGPATNILFASILVIVYKMFGSTIWLYGIYFNLGLALFNFLPIPPLDGSRILVGLVPARIGVY